MILYICTQITTTMLFIKTKKMETATFYIWNTKTGESFDTNEMRFYSKNWDVELEEKSYLEAIMENNPSIFENCIIKNKLD